MATKCHYLKRMKCAYMCEKLLGALYTHMHIASLISYTYHRMLHKAPTEKGASQNPIERGLHKGPTQNGLRKAPVGRGLCKAL